MKITFCGAAQEVTGSSYLLETDTKKYLIDCGLFQGSRMATESNYDDFLFDPKEVSAVFITHAHLDHTGRLPKLAREGFAGTVYATQPTAALAKLIVSDSLHILEEEARRHDKEPIYSAEDVSAIIARFRGVEYREVIQVDEHTTVEFFDAGHILGSSCIRITHNGVSIVFSGDLGNTPVPLLYPTDIIGEANYVVVESTYGGRVHESPAERTRLLKEMMYTVAAEGGVLMIPAFAMERTQEILYECNTFVNNNDIPRLQIFLDSPLAIAATEVFQQYSRYLNPETQEMIRKDADIFSFPGLKMTRTTQESMAISSVPAPKVIIAGSGMAQGGRIVRHIEQYISDPKNRYLIVGYQVQGSLGRRLLDGETSIRMHGEEIPVRAKVKAIGGYSAHADQPHIARWLATFDPLKLRNIFITHGEEDQAKSLSEYIQTQHKLSSRIPSLGDTIELV
ncbi:MAG: MBL fold metallo-hydrolase [Candidatus Kerfeldbacteria bacterium]|nr:MBL fold metallo-hydrolase [Candidatus Kerfeldbacteria bacterium]